MFVLSCCICVSVCEQDAHGEQRPFPVASASCDTTIDCDNQNDVVCPSFVVTSGVESRNMRLSQAGRLRRISSPIIKRAVTLENVSAATSATGDHAADQGATAFSLFDHDADRLA